MLSVFCVKTTAFHLIKYNQLDKLKEIIVDSNYCYCFCFNLSVFTKLSSAVHVHLRYLDIVQNVLYVIRH